MEEAIAIGERPEPLTADDVLAIHPTLMAGEPERVRPGQFLREQNWVGGRLNTPLDARFIPPPEDAVDRFIADLLAFLARDDIPPVAEAAIGHAQFETIHPFVGTATAVSVAAWCASFAGACERAARLSVELAEAVRGLQEQWRSRAGHPRRDSGAARIIEVLPAQPILSTATLRAAIGASHQRALDGLKALASTGVVRQITEGGYDRQFAADELFDLIETYEERIAAP